MDRLNMLCARCGVGFYREANVMDDINGTLHCTNCNHKVNRRD